MLSMSISIPRDNLMLVNASLMIERVFNPRKSILISPVSSMTDPSYWVTSSFSPVSLSSAVLTGTQSVISSRQIIVPQACTPVPLTLPSSIWAYFIVLRVRSSSQAARKSGTAAMQFFIFILGDLPLTSGRRSGMSLVRRIDSERGNSSTRATSLMAILVAIVP